MELAERIIGNLRYGIKTKTSQSSYADFESQMNLFGEHPEQMAERGEQAGRYVAGRAGATDKILKSVGL